LRPKVPPFLSELSNWAVTDTGVPSPVVRYAVGTGAFTGGLRRCGKQRGVVAVGRSEGGWTKKENND
ncbi:hypothetical protein A2U01_0064724, partial [Trifolium medium]|nr:hypothetical protein [Trifolium medium]